MITAKDPMITMIQKLGSLSRLNLDILDDMERKRNDERVYIWIIRLK